MGTAWQVVIQWFSVVGQQHWVKQVHTESALKQDNRYGVKGEHGMMQANRSDGCVWLKSQKQAQLSPDREAGGFLIGLRLIELHSDAMASKWKD